MKLRTLFPFACNDVRVGHILFSLARHLSDTDLGAELWVMWRGPQVRKAFVRAAVPDKMGVLMRGANRLIQPSGNWARKFLERQYEAALQEGDLAHVYRGCSLELMRSLRSRGFPIFLECAIVMDHMAERISFDAFARAGWPVQHNFSKARLDAAQAQADMADFIFSPSPAVTQSLLERGIPMGKVLEGSYGWAPERFTTTARALPEIAGLTVLFLGSIEVRKGAHLLLDAWSKAGINGRLVLAGEMDPLIARRCADHLRRRDVIHLPFNPDPGPVYRSADIFAFPTLEEGSPLVGYEALGNGLPIVTSPMGAGSIIRHRTEGLVVDPHDRDQWIEALRLLAKDGDMRRAMGQAGRVRAAEFTWEKVAKRRRELINAAMVHARKQGVPA